MALTVGVATVLESREVVVVVTGQRKALALSKAIGMSYISSISASLSSELVRKRGRSQSSRMCDFSFNVDVVHPDCIFSQWTLSALQLHPWALIVVDEDATAGRSQ